MQKLLKKFSFTKGRAIRTLAGLFITLIFVGQAGNWFEIPFVERLDGIIYDARLRLTAPGGVDPRIVIIDIDEKSLQERESGGEGRWPWPRDRLALLTNRLFDDYNVNMMGFDVIFSERDESSGIRTIEKLAREDFKSDAVFQERFAKIKPSLDLDSQFAKSLKERPTVLGFSFLTPGDQQKKGVLPPAAFTTDELPLGLVDPTVRQGYTGNLALLQDSAADGGHVNPSIDHDGIIRRMPMLIAYDGKYYESLSLASARTLLGGLPLGGVIADPTNPSFGSLEYLDVGGSLLPVDENLTSFIPYRGPYKSFEYISASDVMNKKVPKEKLEGKIVLVGTTAPGLLDLRATPVGKAYPGVEIHANLIAGILDGTIKQAPFWTYTANFALVAILGLVFALVLPWLSPLRGSILAGVSIASMIGLNLISYNKGIVLPLASVLGVLLLVYLWNIGFGYFIESRSKRLITGLFGQYVPPDLVDEMAKNPANFSMEGESRAMTVLFSDVRGFTTISEALDAKTLSEFINAFLTPFTRIIYNNRGTIDKYMGDCIMAFWGAPLRDENHARNGVISAFAMVNAIEEINDDFAKRNWPPIKVGIGVNTGRMSVGNMGSEIRLAYTVMGDAVNLGSRIEGITKEYGVAIIIGPDTRKDLPDLIARELDKVKVKGKDIAVTIYEPLGFEGQVSPEILTALTLFEKALAAYRNQEWESSKSQLEVLMRDHKTTGEVLYELYLERIEILKDNPPGDDWDGSFTFTKK
ncbi:CHASE2 domain-containing protein [Polynucleobacter sp. UB-Tiil-W10]|uniref:CHASE2 domain-containing protein n=1 Tax=Polynucleobacter sp. UB-Tiil-W10 TaxID=1855648 RepID=UPI001C0E15E3|nr:adenylate/guanylate cyclase domain-containing protein [Polynucleobacter sp. UB-Tiil-W10]MBU3541653.1 adenylate/guanylate cyclase domain-containing protein [Polynucleobacter sp. UB-Tiil-W10]